MDHSLAIPCLSTALRQGQSNHDLGKITTTILGELPAKNAQKRFNYVSLTLTAA
jgi:hypothetical protein